MTDLFKKLCMQPTKGKSITYVTRPKEEKKPEQDIMLFVRLVQKKVGERV